MAIYAIAHGLVTGTPVAVTAEGATATVLILEEECACDLPVEYEVFCREPDLAGAVLQQIRLGDSVLAVGALRLHRVLAPVEEPASAARVVLDATTVAANLGDQRLTAGTCTGMRPGRPAGEPANPAWWQCGRHR
jgi:hypothetical protein